MSDCSLILNYLSDGQWHNVIQIMEALKPGARNWAVRSRISNLKEKGHVIEKRIGENGCADYRLVDPRPVLAPIEIKFEGNQAVMFG